MLHSAKGELSFGGDLASTPAAYAFCETSVVVDVDAKNASAVAGVKVDGADSYGASLKEP